MKAGVLLVTALSLTLACGCAGPELKPATQLTAAGATAANVALPDIHALPLPARSTSAELTYSAEGDEQISSAGQVSAVPPWALEIQADAGELAYAIYGFSLDAEVEVIDSVATDVFDLSADGDQYFAIANYATNRWEIITIAALGTGAQTLVDEDPRPVSEYMRADGACFVAVLAYDAFSLSIDRVSLSASTIELPAPLNFTTNGTGPHDTFGDRIELSWDSVAGAAAYDIYYGLAAEPEPQFSLLVSVDAPTVTFNHTVSSPPESDIDYDVDYIYKVQARVGPELSDFSNTAVGARVLPAPGEVTASFDAHPEEIYLRWTPVAGAFEYEIAVDTEGDLLDDTPATSLTHMPGDFLPHHYFITAVGEDGESRYAVATETPGRCVSWTGHAIDPNHEGQRYHPSLAIIGGKPAIAFCATPENEIQYYRSTVDEPDDEDDWVLSVVDHATVPYPIELVEHAGLPWIIYNDLIFDVSQIHIAYADDAEPDSSEDWNSYKIRDGYIDDLGLRMAEVNGRLHYLYQQLNSDGGQTFAGYATQVQPDSGSDWLHWSIDSTSVSAQDFDLGAVAGGLAVAYEKGDALVYRWSDESMPEESDWTESHPPIPAGGVEPSFIRIVAAPDETPSIAWRQRFEGDPEGRMCLSFTAALIPQNDADWTSSHSTIYGIGSRAGAMCYSRGLAQFAFLSEGERLYLGGALVPQPSSAASDWSGYLFKSTDAGDLMSLPLNLLDYNGRLLLVHTMIIGDDEFLQIERVNP